MGTLGQKSFDDIVATSSHVIPIPLHRSKLAQRGFNQSDLLARLMVQKTSKKVKVVHWLTRHKKTTTQGPLKKQQRIDNLKGAFKVARKAKRLIIESRVVLVDDVMTTGATVREAARTLLNAGAQEVKVWTFCRADH